MKAIVCADINWGIGKGTGMLFHIPADLKFFKEKTMGSTVGSPVAVSIKGAGSLPMSLPRRMRCFSSTNRL